jgi:hypothetical protein
MNQAKFDALGEYCTSPLSTDAERAMLDYVIELTKSKRVERSNFDRMAEHYSTPRGTSARSSTSSQASTCTK